MPIHISWTNLLECTSKQHLNSLMTVELACKHMRDAHRVFRFHFKLNSVHLHREVMAQSGDMKAAVRTFLIKVETALQIQAAKH